MTEIKEAEKVKNNSVQSEPVDKSVKTVDKPKQNGGARPGAGRPKGSMNANTIEKMAAKKKFEDRVAKHADALFDAQVAVAKGVQYLFKRFQIDTPKGKRWSKFEIVQDPDEMTKYLDGEFEKSKTEYFMLTADKPDIHAIDSLLDRAFGRAAQSLTVKDDRPDPIESILKKFGLLEEEGNSDHAGQTENIEGLPPQDAA